MRHFFSRTEVLKPLSNNELINKASSIGATSPFHEVSDKYSFVPTIEVVDALKSEGWIPVQAKQANVRKVEKNGFQKHIIRFQREGLELTNQERVDLMLYNSHDRGCAFNLIASVWRKICGNGLMVSSDLFNFKHRHIGFDRNNLLESAEKISKGAKDIAAYVDDFKSIKLSKDEKGVFAKTSHKAVYDLPELAPIQPYQLLEERRYDDNGDDLWTTYNVIQENIVKGGICGRSRKTGKRLTTRAVKSIDKDVKLNKLLWSLTEEMAKIKSH